MMRTSFVHRLQRPPYHLTILSVNLRFTYTFANQILSESSSTTTFGLYTKSHPSPPPFRVHALFLGELPQFNFTKDRGS